MNKKGEEFVEAAVVLPLVILTILSMIMVAVFSLSHEIRQSKAHTALAEEAASSKMPFSIKRRSVSSSGVIRGTAAGSVSKSQTMRMYVISQSDLIMLGEIAG